MSATNLRVMKTWVIVAVDLERLQPTTDPTLETGGLGQRPQSSPLMVVAEVEVVVEEYHLQ